MSTTNPLFTSKCQHGQYRTLKVEYLLPMPALTKIIVLYNFRYSIVERPLNDWMTDNILALKKIRRQREKIWRQSPITINYDLYYESCKAVKNAIKDSKTVTIQNKINDCKGDQDFFFQNN